MPLNISYYTCLHLIACFQDNSLDLESARFSSKTIVALPFLWVVEILVCMIFKNTWTGCQGLTPVNPPTWEAEFGKIVSSPVQKSL
jgi:hypothetical protein